MIIIGGPPDKPAHHTTNAVSSEPMAPQRNYNQKVTFMGVTYLKEYLKN